MKHFLISLLLMAISPLMVAQTPGISETEIPTGFLTKEGALAIVEEMFPDPQRNILYCSSPELLPGYWFLQGGGNNI